MALVECTVEGPPISHQTKNKRASAAWKAKVQMEAARAWPQAPIKGELQCTIMNFFEGPRLLIDDDNLVKPIRDAMNGIIYEDDGQICHSHYVQTSINGLYQVRGVSKVVLDAFHLGKPFVYIRLEDAPLQTQLPR